MKYWKWRPQEKNENNKREISFVNNNNNNNMNDNNMNDTFILDKTIDNNWKNDIKANIQFISKEKTREKQNNHLQERGNMIQTAINPFLKQSNYINDLETEATLLRPMNSNFVK